MLYIGGKRRTEKRSALIAVEYTSNLTMKYTLQELPAPIRQQVEDYIDFLMEKYQLPPSAQATVPPTEAPGKAFAQRWRGVAKGVDPDAAREEYLNEKHR
jgi:hypothetical protein